MLIERIHRAGTLLLSFVIALLGIAILIQAISGDGGLLSSRVLLGVLMLAAGLGRMYLQIRKSRET